MLVMLSTEEVRPKSAREEEDVRDDRFDLGLLVFVVDLLLCLDPLLGFGWLAAAAAVVLLSFSLDMKCRSTSLDDVAEEVAEDVDEALVDVECWLVRARRWTCP